MSDNEEDDERVHSVAEMYEDWLALDSKPAALAAKNTLPVFKYTSLLSRFANNNKYQIPTEDMIEVMIQGRSPNISDYESKVIRDTLVCTKTTRFSIKELKTTLLYSAHVLSIPFKICITRLENAVKAQRFATLEAIAKQYLDANEKRV